MSPAQEAKLFRLGCTGVMTAVVVLGALAYYLHIGFAAMMVALLAAWGVICRIMGKKDAEALAAAFSAAFAGHEPLPGMRKSYSYAFPHFTITFRSEEEMRKSQADGSLEAFKASIMELYGHSGGKERPFDVGRGVSATYEGWVSTRLTIRSPAACRKPKRKAEKPGRE